MIRTLTCFFLTLLDLPLYSQQLGTYPCGAVAMQQELVLTNPTVLDQQRRLDDNLRIKQAPSISSVLRSTQPVIFTIPVVIHIIHENGFENISDAQALSAIQHLNQAFEHSGSYAALGAGTNTNIQFCLAERTPQNLPSNGITRDVSALTDMNMEIHDLALKNLNRWDPQQYINIWVVRSINSLSQGPGVAGYAYFATAHGTDRDGIVCESEFFGKSPSNDVVLIHEMGHYLNLYHTFEGGCSNFFCDTEGDQVCDTPPDQALHTDCIFNSCHTDTDDIRPLNPLTNDVDDGTENFMDYSPFNCQHTFTQGQALRMVAVLETARASLLVSPACLPPCTQPISAEFELPTNVATGTPVTFLYSGTGASNFDWWVNGTFLSNLQSPGYVFTEPGVHIIELRAGNNDPNCFASKKDTIEITCNINIAFAPGSSSIMLGEAVQFTSTSVGATDLEWSVDDTLSGSGNNFAYTFHEVKDYVVQLTASNQYCSSTAFGNVTVESPCKDSIWQSKYLGVNALAVANYGFPDGSQFFIGQGSFGSGTYLFKIAPDGSIAWTKRRSTSITGSGVAAYLPDGNHVIAYKVSDSPDRFAVEKITPDGQTIWVKGFSGNYIYDILTEADGDILICTWSVLVKLDSSGNQLWSRLGISRIEPRSDGSYFCYANLQTPTRRVYMHLSADGDILAQTQLENTSFGGIEQLSILPDDGAVSLVTLGIGIERVFVRFNPDLSIAWAKSIGNTNFINTYLMANKAGDILIGRKKSDTQDVYVCFSGNGDYKWAVNCDVGAASYLSQPGSNYLEGWAVYKQTNNGFFNIVLPTAERPEGCWFSPGINDYIDYQMNAQASNHVVNNYTLPTFNYVPVTSTFNLTQVKVCRVSYSCFETCDNSVDDDNDGLVDCADPDCHCAPCDLSDGALQIDSIWCSNSQTNVRVTVCNNGSATLPSTTPIAFYDQDPTLVNANPLAHPQTLGASIAPNNCQTMVFQLSGGYVGKIFAVLNDAYTVASPFTFPVGNLLECNYSNNIEQTIFEPAIAQILNLGPDREVCSNSITVLTAAAGFVQYRWNNGATDSVFTAFSPGLYWVDTWDACGQHYTDSIQLFAKTTESIELGMDRTICSGDSVALQIPDFEIIKWWPDSNLSCNNCTSLIASPNFTTTYHVIAANGDCFSGDSVRIEVLNQPLFDLGDDQQMCNGDTATLGIQAVPGTTYYWNTGDTDSEIRVTQPDIYILNAEFGACSSSDTIALTLKECETSCDTKINGCLNYELLGIASDAQQRYTYRFRVTNHCSNKLIYSAIQLPDGIVAVSPPNLSNYVSQGGLNYAVRNPNYSPFYSIRFKSAGIGIADGASDVFEFTLPAQTHPVFFKVTSSLEPNVFYEASLNTFNCPVVISQNRNEHGVSPEGHPSGILLYPNPTNGDCIVNLSRWHRENLKIQILDIHGQLVQSYDLKAAGYAQNIYLGSQIPAGFYFLEVITERGEREIGRLMLVR